LLVEIWPAAIAAVAMGAGLFCVEHLLVHSAARGTVAGLVLLAGETVLGTIAYLVCLLALSPGVKADLMAALGALLRRSRSGDLRTIAPERVKRAGARSRLPGVARAAVTIRED
jgi:hypothetical protein